MTCTGISLVRSLHQGGNATLSFCARWRQGTARCRRGCQCVSIKVLQRLLQLDTRTPLAITTGANALHLAVAPVLIWNAGMGVGGAATATAAAEWAAAAAYLGCMWHHRQQLGGIPFRGKCTCVYLRMRICILGSMVVVVVCTCPLTNRLQAVA